MCVFLDLGHMFWIPPWVLFRRGLQVCSYLSHLKGFKMKTNIGGVDRGVRITVGLALVALAATGTLGAWAWLGAIPLATGLIGWCPPYAMFGWSTCSAKH